MGAKNQKVKQIPQDQAKNHRGFIFAGFAGKKFKKTF